MKINSKSLLRTFLLMALVAASTSARAQTEFSAPRTSLSTLSLEGLLATKVSIASKTLESPLSASSSVTVFSRAEISRMGVQTLEELLNHVPGFNVTTDAIQGKIASVGLRGSVSSQSKSVLVLLDGEPLNDAISGSAFMMNRYIPVDDIEQVEIIRGPGSALYGSNAFAGVVSVISRRYSNDLTARVGSTDSKSLAINFSRKMGEVEVSASAFGLSEQGFLFRDVTDTGGQTRNMRDGMSGINLKSRIDYKDLALTFRHYERSARGFSGYGMISDDNQGRWAQTWLGLRYMRSLLDGKLELAAGATLAMEKSDVLALVIPQGAQPFPGLTLQEPFFGGPFVDSRTVRGGVDAKWQVIEDMQLSAGVSATNTWITDLYSWGTHNLATFEYVGEVSHDFGGAELWADPDATRLSLGGYLQDTYTPVPWLSLTAGARVDYYNDVGAAFSPRVASVFTLPLDSYLRLSYGRAFRAPNLFEMYDRNNPSDYGNPNLKPETLDSFEVGYSQRLANLVTGSLVVFHNRAHNLILLGQDRPVAPDNLAGGRQYQNVGESETTGFELEGKAEPVKNLMIGGAFSHNFSSNSKGIPTPKDMASGSITYTLGDASLNLNGIARRSINGLAYTEGYVIVNATLQYAVVKGLTLGVTGQNLGDTRYRAWTQYGLPDGLPARGRTVLAMLTLQQADD